MLATPVYETACTLIVYEKTIEPKSHKDYEVRLELDASNYKAKELASVIDDWLLYDMDNKPK